MFTYYAAFFTEAILDMKLHPNTAETTDALVKMDAAYLAVTGSEMIFFIARLDTDDM